MEPVSPLTPSLRVDGVKLYQGDRQQQSPFSRGKIFQGLIIGKKNNQFILDVDGQQWIADSKAPLQIGQHLNLQVTGTKPQVTLQILTDSLTQNIGKSLHLLTNEGQLLPKTLELAGVLPENALSPPARETLNFFANTSESFVKTTFQSGGGGNRLADLLTGLVSSQTKNTDQTLQTRLSALVQTILQSLPENDPRKSLAQLLDRQLQTMDQNGSIRSILLGDKKPAADEQFQLFLQTIGNQQTDAGTALVNALRQFLADDTTASPTPLLLRLLSLTEQLQESRNQQPHDGPQGRNLKQFIDRLGTNLEHLLGTGRTEEAARTLKNTLLEISHNLTENKPLQQQADQLTSSLELLQMLQVRLAGESIFVLPLPLPFLNQGFLLVEPDGQQNGQEQGDTSKKRYSLHLQLEGLGNLRIELQQQETGMRLRFFSEDTDRTKFLSEHRQELQQWLTATTLESIQFLTGAGDPIQQLLSHMANDTTGALDTSA